MSSEKETSPSTGDAPEPFSVPEQLKEGIKKLEDLLQADKMVVLLGAGASSCAGLPLMNRLTEEVLEKIPDDSKKILEVIKKQFSGEGSGANIEDYLSELFDWIAITSRRKKRTSKDSEVYIGEGELYSHEKILKAIEKIKQAIYEVINKKDVNSATHERFVKALYDQAMRPGKDNQPRTIDYLVMNYDTLIEDSLALSKLRYADGFEGGVYGWWCPQTFEQKNLDARVFKLHGSIDWTEDSDLSTPLRIAPHLKREEGSGKKIMIWPASTKYRETQLDPYATLMQKARETLNCKGGSQRVLLIVGYSFGDAHINLEIKRGLKESQGNLTVIAFTEDELKGDLKDWYEDELIKHQVLIFTGKAFHHADQNPIESNSGVEWWKFECLTKIFEGNIEYSKD